MDLILVKFTVSLCFSHRMTGEKPDIGIPKEAKQNEISFFEEDVVPVVDTDSSLDWVVLEPKNIISHFIDDSRGAFNVIKDRDEEDDFS